MMKDIDRVQRDTSVERLAQARGIKLHAKGERLLGTCPFHPRSKPVLTIDPKGNAWACATCKVRAGTVIEWTMKAEGVSRKHAIELLRADHGAAAGGGGKLVKNSSAKELPAFIEPDADDHALLARVVGYYQDTLKADTKALAFLADNGITNGDIITRHKIGLADRTLAYRLPDGDRKLGAELRGRLQRLGIVRESGHEHLRGCVIVPILDDAGHIVSIYGRRLKLGAGKIESPDVFTTREPKGVWNIEAFTASKDIIVTASAFEAMAAWCSGLRNVTAAWGLDGFGADHVQALRRHGTERVLIAYPRTAEGDTAATKLGVKLAGLGIEVMRVLLPADLDVIGYLRTSSTGGLAHLVRQAEWIGGVRKSSPMTALTTAQPALSRIVSEGSSESASPAPVEPTADTAGDITITLGDRRWRVRGLSRNLSYETMRVNLFVGREHDDPRLSGFFIDNLEMYSARQRASYVQQAAEELAIEPAVIKADLGHVLLHLEGLQDRQIKAALAPKDVAPEMTEGDRDAALALLHDPKLLDRIIQDFETCGVVGESTNLLVGHLAAISRKLDDPLAVLVQSSSAAGKSSLLDAVLAFVPEEDRVEFSAMTGQSLFYVEPGHLRHKVLAISEEAGAEKASYALKLLQSEGSLTIASTAKEAGTGRLVTHEYKVEGPVSLMMTTTATQIDPELQNRCIVLSVDEGPEQTRAIHRRQRERETLDGLLARHERDRIVNLHRNAQRLLRPLLVVNPHAPELTFLDGSTRARRDHTKYLTLIRAIALLHQHQRTVKQVMTGGRAVEYVEATKDDIAVADRLVAEVIGRSLDDLSPHTRQVLALLDAHVAAGCERQAMKQEDFRFSRREARERLGMGGTQLWVHLRRLVEAEYIVVHPSRRGRGVVYELAPTMEHRSGVVGDRSGVIRPSFGADSGGAPGASESASTEKPSVNGRSHSGSSESRHRGDASNGRRTRRSENGVGAG